MRVPVSWLREYVDLPADVTAADLAAPADRARPQARGARVARRRRRGPAGRRPGARASTPSRRRTARPSLVPGRLRPEHGEPRGIVCGAAQLRARATSSSSSLPGAVLPGGFEIAARKTYGHVSDGMICSTTELGIGDDHGGILVLDPGSTATSSPATTPSTCSACATTSSSSRSTPTGPTRCRCAASPARRRIAYDVAVPRPGAARRAGARRPAATRSGSRHPTAARSSSPARSPASTRPRPTPRWMARRRPAGRACGRSRWPSTSPTT